MPIALLIGSLVLSTASAEEFVRRPATVIRLQPETIANVTFQWVYLRVEPKSRTRDAKPRDTKLDTTTTKIAFVSPTGHRRDATRNALKAGAHVLVSGWESVSSVPTATDIQILETK